MIAFDYRGFGNSGRLPHVTEATLVDDVLSVFDYVMNNVKQVKNWTGDQATRATQVACEWEDRRGSDIKGSPSPQYKTMNRGRISDVNTAIMK